MKTKTCTNSDCPEENPQPFSNFGQCYRTKDGLSRQCKFCLRRRFQRWSKTEKGRKSIEKAKAKYRKTEKNRTAQRRYLQSEKGRVKHLASVKQWRIKNRDAYRALRAVNYAVSTGKMPPVKTLACLQCEQPAKIYHHHKGYDKEYRLDVIPLCIACHKGRHRKLD